MKLHVLESASFGTLQITEPLEFSAGLNLVCARNQAGKTTLLTLIEWALYGVPPHSSGKRSQAVVERNAPWQGGKPQAVLTILPERLGWPAQLRVEVHFDDFNIHLTDVMTLEDLSAKVVVERNGSWDLGLKLTGLRREAFRTSLLALQGQLENVLNDAELRKVLTEDLAGLVEDPERATLDSAILALEKPVFTMGEFQTSPILLRNLVKNAESEMRATGQRLSELRHKYQSLEQVLTEREQHEYSQSDVQLKLKEHEERLKKSELAVAHWRFGEVFRCQERLRDWSRRLAEAPWLDKFPADLEGAVKHWQGEEVQYRQGLEKQQRKLEDAQREQSQLEARIKADEAFTSQLGYQRELNELAVNLEIGRKELDTANWKVKEFGEGTDAAVRTRYETLNARVKGHREAIPALLEWLDKDDRVRQERERLAARQAELKPLAAKTTLTRGLAGALSLLLCGILVILALIVPSQQAAFLIGSVVLLALGVFLIVSMSSRHRKAAIARKELANSIEPGLAEVGRAEADLGRRRDEIKTAYELSEEDWKQLQNDLPEYQKLHLRLENYAQAMRDREAAETRIGEAWSRVRVICPDTPLLLKPEWLSGRIDDLLKVRERQVRRMDLAASIKDEERNLLNMQRSGADLRSKLGRLLSPLGLEQRAVLEPEDAIRLCEGYLREARDLQSQRELLATAEENAHQISMQREEYEHRADQLSREELRELAGMVHDEDGYHKLNRETRALRDELAKLRQSLDGQSSRLGRLREMAAKEEEALTLLPEAEQAYALAQQQHAKTELWSRAIEVLTAELLTLRGKLAGNLAPQITEELRLILRQAPLRGIEDAAVGGQLELRLRLSDAPPGLSGLQLLECLSLGARRQLALCLRCAVARALGADHAAPLLLDEPLAELDDANSMAWLGYLAQLTGTHQVFLTTCHRAQFDWLMAQTGVRMSAVQLP